MNPIIRELLIEEPIKLSPEGQQAVISAYDIAVKNGFVGTESEWLQTLQFIQSPITAEVLAAAQAAAASALAAGDSEQVAMEKAAEMIQLAQAVLALRNQAESLASASEGFATDSGISAASSELAKGLSEAAKVIAIEESGKSLTKAGESAASAVAAEAAKNQIVDKAEVNITTAGHILLADGATFKSVDNRNVLLGEENANVILFDNFRRANGSPVQALTGQNWTYEGEDPEEGIINNRLVFPGNTATSTNLYKTELPENQLIRNFIFAGQPTGGSASHLTLFIIYLDLNNFLAVSFLNINSSPTTQIKIQRRLHGSSTDLQELSSKVTTSQKLDFSLDYKITVALHTTGSIPKITIFIAYYEVLFTYEVTGADYTFFSNYVNTIGIGASKRRSIFDYIKITGKI
jgi:hypothetical protein